MCVVDIVLDMFCSRCFVSMVVVDCSCRVVRI